MTRPQAPREVRVGARPRLIPSSTGYQVMRPGARYTLRREGEARRGEWVDEEAPLPEGSVDVFPEDEARTILGFLSVQGAGGRPAARPTTDDGRLIARACARLSLTGDALAKKIGVDPSVLSKARRGRPLSRRNRDAIRALMKEKDDV
jgi:hypothetical protein